MDDDAALGDSEGFLMTSSRGLGITQQPEDDEDSFSVEFLEELRELEAVIALVQCWFGILLVRVLVMALLFAYLSRMISIGLSERE